MESFLLNAMVEYNRLVRHATEFFNYALINYGIVLNLHNSLFGSAMGDNSNFPNDDDNFEDNDEGDDFDFYGIDLRGLKIFSAFLCEDTKRAIQNARSICIKIKKRKNASPLSPNNDNNDTRTYDPLELYYMDEFRKIKNNRAIGIKSEKDEIRKKLRKYIVKQGDELYLLFIIINELNEKVKITENLYLRQILPVRPRWSMKQNIG